MSIKGPGGRTRTQGTKLQTSSPNGGDIIAQEFPKMTNRRLRRPAFGPELRNEAAMQLIPFQKAMGLA